MRARKKNGKPEIVRVSTNSKSTLRRAPQKSASEDKETEKKQEIIQLRARLLQNPDTQGINFSKLIAVQSSMKEYINGCLSEKDYIKAKNGFELDAVLKKEIERQAKSLNQFVSRQKAASTISRKIKQTEKAYVSRSALCGTAF